MLACDVEQAVGVGFPVPVVVVSGRANDLVDLVEADQRDRVVHVGQHPDLEDPLTGAHLVAGRLGCADTQRTFRSGRVAVTGGVAADPGTVA